ncbi:hypothetical protein BDQ17DRAFT_1333420 [Cyathus striatus]|nr:hypothetical protein BDQ17DRAFT_1333420 [Cyathus striatus]
MLGLPATWTTPFPLSVYALITTLLWTQNTLPYTDIHTATTHPHPYNSFANDEVRMYLLDQTRNLATGHTYMEVDDDLSSTAMFVNAKEGVSFEGNNVLVQVDVSTAPGVTDNATAVASLFVLLEYPTMHRVKRTAIFNFHNGEGDGLNGAHACAVSSHPTCLTNSYKFLNFEGPVQAGTFPILPSGSARYVPYPTCAHTPYSSNILNFSMNRTQFTYQFSSGRFPTIDDY